MNYFVMRHRLIREAINTIQVKALLGLSLTPLEIAHELKAELYWVHEDDPRRPELEAGLAAVTPEADRQAELIAALPRARFLAKHVRSKYWPHQGARECARRVVQNGGGYRFAGYAHRYKNEETQA